MSHALPRLHPAKKLAATGALLVGWTLFASAWLAAAMAAGWGLSLSVLLDMGELVHALQQTTPALFHLTFLCHALSLPLILAVTRFLVGKLSLPRGFRTALSVGVLLLALLDVSLFALLGRSELARTLLAPVLVLETLVLLATALSPVREMWVYARWKGAERPRRVVIVGGGFAGLYTALGLDALLGYHDDLEVTLVDKNNFFLFPPLLPSAATGAIETRQVTTPFRQILEATAVRFRKATVESIDVEGRSLVARNEHGVACSLDYDVLVVAPGARTNTFDVPGAAEHAFFMREIGDAMAVRNHIIDCFERAASSEDAEEEAQLLRFIVVGAGPTGVELASEAQDLIHHVLLNRYPEIDPGSVEVHLVQGGDRVLPGWHDLIAEKTQGQLERIGVQLCLGARVVEVGPDFVRMKDGRELRGRTIVWCCGVKPAAIVQELGVEPQRGGRIKVGPDLRVRDEVFVLGDVAWCEHDGDPLPPLAQVALQQGAQTGPNIVRLLQGKALKPFKYLDYGALVCVGEHYAVVDLMGIRLSGFVAWFIWRTLYLAKLVGFSNKIRVVIDWTLDLLVERSIAQIHATGQDLSET